MSDPTLVILAAGRARRYGGLKQLAPVGLFGEAVIDLTASDAVAGGFTRIVVVVNPATGPEVREHIETTWPQEIDIAFAIQEHPRGTVHAVLAAREQLDDSSPFGVANADDMYGREAMTSLGRHLRDSSHNCLVGFRLERAFVGDQPVTRGVCKVTNAQLISVVERHQVQRCADGFIAEDGLQPRALRGDTRVSMNLWGFQPTMWAIFRDAMASAHDAPDGEEVLLPTVVGRSLQDGASFSVLEVNSQCLGVTHQEDLPLVQAAVRDEVTRGDRPTHAFA